MSFSRLCQYSVVIALCCFLGRASIASTCSDSEFLKSLIEVGNYRSALQRMDRCLRASKQPEADDWQLFNELIKQVLTVSSSTSFEEAYRNFQKVLQIHLLSGLKFKLASYFEDHPTDNHNLFSEVRETYEKYYFYYDTGRLFSHSRGIALTERSLIWKNFTGEPHRLAFDNINSMTLAYDRGFSLNSNFSLTGWKLRINSSNKRCANRNASKEFPTSWQKLSPPDSVSSFPSHQRHSEMVFKLGGCFDEKNEIRLSSVPDKAIIPLVSAITYFINSNKTSFEQKKMVPFYVPEREIGILAGWVTPCRKEYVNQRSPIKELQLLDACFFRFLSNDEGFKLSQQDSELLNSLTAQIFEKDNISFNEAYNRFKVVLSTHFFSDLDFKFKDNFDAETEVELFEGVRDITESYYFYFDTGRVMSGSRGLALTKKAIIWNNFWTDLTGSAKRVTFDNISSVTLVHESDLQSLGGWRLILNKDENKDEDNEIALSQVPAENVELFASALVYFINRASGANLKLQVPKETRAVLDNTFEEMHPKANHWLSLVIPTNRWRY
jgi:hypothetical protein